MSAGEEKIQWSIIVHGGAKEVEPEKEDANKQGVKRALEKGAEILKQGGTAVDAVEAAVKVLEDDKTFNAGSGSCRRANGDIEMDAAVMEGRRLQIGAVASIREVKNPIAAARLLLEDKAILLVGPPALQYALANALPLKTPQDEEGDECSHDTVGCVARDAHGDIAIGVSTGGLEGAVAGRVGDSALPACGFYADNERGGVCMSGDGEAIARAMLTAEVLRRLEDEEGEKAIEGAFEKFKRVEGEAGCILINRHGEPAWAHNSAHFPVALQTSQDTVPKVYLGKGKD